MLPSADGTRKLVRLAEKPQRREHVKRSHVPDPIGSPSGLLGTHQLLPEQTGQSGSVV